MTRWVAEWRSLAPLSRVGLLILLVGAAADAVAHASAWLTPTASSFTPQERLAHVLILIGMLGVLLGIVLDVVWPPRRDQSRNP